MKDTIIAEIDFLKKNQTWEAVPRSKGKNVINCRWVYKTKFTSNSVVECHKARLVANEFSQQEGIEYIETFVVVSKINYV